MTSFAEFPLLSLFVLALVVIVLVSVFSPRKSRDCSGRQCSAGPGGMSGGSEGGGENRVCRACARRTPGYAMYCRNCGPARVIVVQASACLSKAG